MNDSIPIQLPTGQITSGRWDDFEAVGNNPTEKIIVADTGTQIHDMPEQWLRSRVRGWMELIESPNLAKEGEAPMNDYWIGTYTADGRNSKWISCSSRNDQYVPMMHRVEFARDVCREVNKYASNGGAWLTGWIKGGHEFYLLWKDPDGDIAIPLECSQPYSQIIGWGKSPWVVHCQNAIEAWRDIYKAAEIKQSQQRKLAQGEKMDVDKHLATAAPQLIV